MTEAATRTYYDVARGRSWPTIEREAATAESMVGKKDDTSNQSLEGARRADHHLAFWGNELKYLALRLQGDH